MGCSCIKAVLPALLFVLLAPQRVDTAFFVGDGLRTLALEAVETLTPSADATEPPVMFALRSFDPVTEESFPAGDAELEEMRGWQVQILDRGGRKVAFLQGRGSPSSTTMYWSGFSRSGEPLPSGFYRARLVWTDSGKNAHATGEVSFALFTPLEIRNMADKKLRFSYTSEGLVVNIQEKMIFRVGESRILPGALPALKEISRFLKTYYKNHVSIRGFTDSTGSLGRNLTLSYDRASRVYSYLVAAGIDQRRLGYKGMGPATPIASNNTEEGRARNRRVEVVVLRTKG